MSKIVVLQDKDGETVYPVGVGFSQQAIVDLFYPVGSYYETSDTSFNPNTAWGGTWVEDSYGKVTVAYQNGDANFGTVGQTGGEKTHKLVNNELPKLHGEGQFKPYDSFDTSGIVSGKHWSQTKNFSAQSGMQANTAVYGFQIDFGNDQPHNNIQPYIVVKRWHRTA